MFSELKDRNLFVANWIFFLLREFSFKFENCHQNCANEYFGELLDFIKAIKIVLKLGSKEYENFCQKKKTIFFTFFFHVFEMQSNNRYQSNKVQDSTFEAQVSMVVLEQNKSFANSHRTRHIATNHLIL